MQSNHLAVYDRAGVTVIAQMDAPGYWGLAIRVGARVGLFNTGSGHVLLAFRSAESAGDDDRRTGGRRATSSASPDDLDERLAQIRQRGYEVMPSQQTAGVYNLSAPVLGGDGAAHRRAHLPLYRAAQPAEGARHSRNHRDAAGDAAAALSLADRAGKSTPNQGRPERMISI